jgi:hypothetical protein
MRIKPSAYQVVMPGRRAIHLSPLAGRGRIALAIRVRGSLRERGGNGFENSRHVTQDVIIPKSQDPVIVIGKPFVSNHVTRVVGMLSSVQLDDQPVLAADKINYVTTNRILTNEFVTVESAGPETVPQGGLCIRCIASQASDARSLDLVGTSHVETPPHPDCCAIRPLPARGERLTPRTVP